jgi:hypothetical protein
MSALKNQKGVNILVNFIIEQTGFITVLNDRIRNPLAENDEVIYSKNLRDLIALRDRKLNQSRISAIQKISIINTYYFDFSQSKKIDMIMDFVYNKMTSIGYQKIRDISSIMSMWNDYLLALKNPSDSIADVNATYKTMNEIKQYIDANMNSIATEFKLSEKIEGNYWGRNEWLPVAGRIAYCNDDGTFCIRYDNRKAGIQNFVDKKNIRSISKHRANQTKKQCQSITETYNRFNTNYYARVYMQKDFRKTNLNDDVVINIMSYF